MESVWEKLAMKRPFLALAPMYDVTDVVFREVVAEAAAPDVFFTEFVNCEALQSEEGKEAHLPKFKFTDKQRPIVAQIWGAKPESYFEAAKLVRELGLDGVDINMGCPEKSVLKTGAGAALIENRRLTAELIQAAREGARNLPVSVKTRIGIKEIITEEWMGWLLDQNLPAITVHARTVKEMSEVPAHWDEVKKVVELRNQMQKKTLIIGNGDVRDAVEARRKTDEFEVDGVMIGRGIFRDLLAFDAHRRWTDVPVSEKLAWLERHISLFERYWQDEKNPEIMKKFAKVYLNGFPEAKKMRQELMEADSLKGMRAMLDGWKVT